MIRIHCIYGSRIIIVTGEVWTNVEPPAGAHLKQISVGADVVWALDTAGRLSVRREIQPKIFPEGTHWQTLPAMPNDPIHIGKNNSFSSIKINQ